MSANGHRPRTASPWAALAALSLGLFMIVVDTSIVSVAVPTMVRSLNTGLNAVVWVTSVYLLMYAVPMLFTSRLGDRYGPKRVFVAGLAVFTGASLCAGLSASVETLIASRAAQGLGAALLTPQTLTLITHLFPGGDRGRAMGVLGGASGLATVTGPLLGGVLVDGLGWQWIFYVNVVVGVATSALSLLVIPDWRPGHTHRFDMAGILLSGAGLFLIVFGIQNGQTYDWGELLGPITVFHVIAVGVALLVAFVIWQRVNRNEPLVPLRTFADRNFSMGALTTAALGFTLTGMFLPLVIYLQSALGLSPTDAGLVTAPMALVSGLMGPFIGRLSDRVSGKYLVMSGLLGMALGLGIIALQAEAELPPWQLTPGLLVCGLGMGFVLVPVNNVAMGTVPAELRGAASGIFFTARQLGAVLGSATIGVLLQMRIVTATANAADTASAHLPARYRRDFLEYMRDTPSQAAGAPGTETSLALPGHLARQGQQLAEQAVRNGLTQAAKETLIPLIAVLLLGTLAGAAMRRTKPVSGPPGPADYSTPLSTTRKGSP
ncbi:EmrB/QacA family drug resistance transporter [Streptomyces bingchenggensis BCW-1]|uniref:EmrB/QacA family drug resistance transporter n=2 Tax=Streptomyces TaxID=1883 RepID=D7CFB1_STRBB|nr:DHA2 family efflux MFS transporter permease subunit [Streptomyces bingchenggensis]ADI13127.1 EmrB/QacA family drug resistance transporter [Streptomyces bingchenggensis BCW-1]